MLEITEAEQEKLCFESRYTEASLKELQERKYTATLLRAKEERKRRAEERQSEKEERI